jgi:hypothetical protein
MTENKEHMRETRLTLIRANNSYVIVAKLVNLADYVGGESDVAKLEEGEVAVNVPTDLLVEALVRLNAG